MRKQKKVSKQLQEQVSFLEEKILSGKKRFESLNPLDKEIIGQALYEQISKAREAVVRGYEAIVSEIISIKKGEKTYEKETVTSIKALFPSKQQLIDLADSPKLQESLRDGTPLFSLLGIEKSVVVAIYEIASDFLERGEDEKAKDAFSVLMMLSPQVVDFWIGHAGSLIRLGEKSEAKEVLQRALYVDRESSTALILLCRVLVEDGRRKEAEARLGAKIDESARKGDIQSYELYETVRLELMNFLP